MRRLTGILNQYWNKKLNNMCGIVGFFSADGFNHQNIVEDMMDAIKHRGPDDKGFWHNSESSVYLGHRRLSVVDLSSLGHQPMTSNDGNLIIIFNGEIYNHNTLREILIKKVNITDQFLEVKFNDGVTSKLNIIGITGIH